MTDTQSHPETLARQHWAYVESVLKAHQVHNTVVEVCGHHYRTAFVHGYKHAIEDLERPTELCEVEYRVCPDCGERIQGESAHGC